MSVGVITIGPHDHGRPMGLAEFADAVVEEGYLYELSRGVITVSDVPGRKHLVQVLTLRRQLNAYELTHPGMIYGILTGSECKVPVEGLQSERHPDLVVYKKSPPLGDDFWASWVPEVVVEVVSESSEQRDYEEKPEEYLQFGVREYWIFDLGKREMTAHRRSGGQWKTRVVRPPQVYKTRLFPGLEIDCGAVFDAVE